MQTTFLIMDATRKHGTTQTGANKGKAYDMLALILSERPGPNRTNGEFEFSPGEDDAKRLTPPNGDVGKLAGRELTVTIKELKAFGIKLQIRGNVVFSEPAK